MRRRDYEVESICEQFRLLRADYDAAKKTRFKRTRTGIVPTGSGADYHYKTWTAYASILETARDLFRNHVLIGQGVRRLVANILRGGFTLDVKTGSEGLNDELVGRWQDWASDPICDIQGEQNFHGLETFVLQQTVVDGDILTLPTRDGNLQLVESHRLRTPTGTTRNVVHGVLLDDFRRRQEYWVTKDDISPFAALSLVGQVTRYAARAPDELTGRDERQVLHHYMPDRVSQTRGLTALVPVVDTAGMGDDLMFAQLVKAQMAACVTILRELAASVTLPPALGGNGQEVTTESRPTGTTRQIAGWQPGMELFGFPGESLKGFSPNVPNPEFFQHAKLILTILASNLDLPLAVLLLDPSETNFSGWRGAMDQARQRFQTIQRWLIDSFHTPVYRWKVRQWAASDPAIRKALEETVRLRGTKGINVFRHVWHAQEWPYIEPTQDALGDVIQERNLLISPRRRAARRGIDYDDLTTEIMEDREQVITKAHQTAVKLNKAHGLQLSWKDIAHWPMPEGVTVNVGNAPQQQQTKPPAREPEEDTEQAVSIAPLRERMNGHACN